MIPQVQQEIPVAPTPTEAQWSLAKRIGFRFVFCYFFLYIAPGAVGSLGVAEKVGSYHTFFADLWRHIVPWVGSNLLGLHTSLVEIPNGSGDQLYDYVLILCIFCLALLGAVLWSVFDRKRENYRQLYQWLRLFMRLALGITLMQYGASKLLPMQFADISYGKLLDPLGHLSPMGLLWAFMGYSRAYAFFGGVGEMLGGLLLMVPEFTALGALISMAVLSNVLMLNLCYDVPRKIYTIHLVLMAAFLVLPDAKRIANLFIFNRKTEPAAKVPFFKDKQLNRGVILLQYLYVAAALVAIGDMYYPLAVQNQARMAAPLRGIWSVQQFTFDGTSLPPLVTDSQRWYHVVFDAPHVVTIQPMSGPLQVYSLNVAENGKAFSFGNAGDHPAEGSFVVNMPGSDSMVLTGQFDGHPVNATLRRVDLSDPSKFLLTNEGFHWVTPAPRWR